MNVKKLIDILQKPKDAKELASRMGIDVAKFYYIRKHALHKITVKHLECIADYFKVPIGYFFDLPDMETLVHDLENIKQTADAYRKLAADKDTIIQLLNEKIQQYERRS
jgi:transcriptional regulator with XRE-family HTH domain